MCGILRFVVFNRLITETYSQKKYSNQTDSTCLLLWISLKSDTNYTFDTAKYQNQETTNNDHFSPQSFIATSLSAFLLSKHSIPVSDIIFAVVYPIYICLANTLYFNSNALALLRGRVIKFLGHKKF